MTATFKVKKPEPTQSPWVTLELENGMLNLPPVGQYCLFEFWKCFPTCHSDGSVERIKAYGYLLNNNGRKSEIFLPLYKQHVNVCKAARYQRVEMPVNSGSKKFNE